MTGEHSGFAVETGALARHAEEFGPLAERASRIAAELRQVLDEEGHPWGGDAVGQSFAAAHAAPAAEAGERLDGLATELADIGARFADAAAAYRSADEAAAAAARTTGPAS